MNLFLHAVYRQPIVIDAISYFRTIHDYHENDALYRLLNLPVMQITNYDIRTLMAYANRKNVSLFATLKIADTLGVSTESLTAIQKLLEHIDIGMAEARNTKPAIMLFKFLERSGYLKWLTEAETRNDRDAIRQIFELRQFFNFIDSFEKNLPAPSLNDFMKYF